MVFLELLVCSVEFVFFQVHIVDVLFLVLIMTFLEKFCLLCSKNVKENKVLDCPNHRDKICILRRLKKIKDTSGLVKSLKSETDEGLSSCSSFPERPKLEEIKMDKPVLP